MRKQGAEPLVGPAMVEAPLTLGPELHAFAAALRKGEVDALLVLTGVGNRKLVTLLEPIMDKEELRDLLAKIVVYCAAAVVRSAVLVAVVICGEGGPTQGAVIC